MTPSSLLTSCCLIVTLLFPALPASAQAPAKPRADKTASHDHDAQAPAPPGAAPAPAAPAATPAPPAGLPGWIARQAPEKLEALKAIWRAEGRVLYATKEMITAKRHELDALLSLPESDDKAVQAAVKDILAWEEKLLQAEIALRRKLEKEGLDTFGRFDHGKHRLMPGHGEGMMDKGMTGKGMMDKGKSGASGAPAAPAGGDHSGH